jgi:hypothetical protein
MKAFADLVVSIIEVIASSCTTAIETITIIIVAQALNSGDRELTLRWDARG